MNPEKNRNDKTTIITHINNFIKSPKGSLALTLLVFAVAYFYEYFEDKLNKINIIYGAIFTIFIVIISIIIYANYSKLEIKEEYEKNNNILKAFIEGHGLGNIINEQELTRTEEKANDIWVFTLDLSNDTGDDINDKKDNKIYETVEKNLKKGKKYTYFLPDIRETYGAIEKFKSSHDFNEGQVKFCLIPPKEFHIVSETVVYDKKKALQWFPGSKINYYIKLDDKYRRNIVGSGKILMEKYLKNVY
jgi:hypothetical protein